MEREAANRADFQLPNSNCRLPTARKDRRAQNTIPPSKPILENANNVMKGFAAFVTFARIRVLRAGLATWASRAIWARWARWAKWRPKNSKPSLANTQVLHSQCVADSLPSANRCESLRFVAFRCRPLRFAAGPSVLLRTRAVWAEQTINIMRNIDWTDVICFVKRIVKTPFILMETLMVFSPT